jgi:hypothetical protein
MALRLSQSLLLSIFAFSILEYKNGKFPKDLPDALYTCRHYMTIYPINKINASVEQQKGTKFDRNGEERIVGH